jgi:hypothetical protein
MVVVPWLLVVVGSLACIGLAADASQITIATPFGPSTAVPDPAKGSNGWYTGEAGVTETLFILDFDMGLTPWLVNVHPVFNMSRPI